MSGINFEECALGLELGSTVIKAVLIDKNGKVAAKGGYRWQNSFENGWWTYSENEIIGGIRACYKSLKNAAEERFGKPLEKIGCIGVSAMMHGYIALDENDKLLVPFRTWRNVRQKPASDELSSLFGFNVPQRFTVSHFYQAALCREPHVKNVCRIFTLASYVHYLLTDNFVIGFNDASGAFPLDFKLGCYNSGMIEKFNSIIAEKGVNKKIENMLPKPLRAGEIGGFLTEKGAALLDDSGTLKSGCMLCPPEGDAGTGMVATNTVKPGTGNVSAGTSIFATFVLKNPLAKPSEDIDVMTSPSGFPVAMVHCNNCSSEINEWAGLFKEILKKFNVSPPDDELFSVMFEAYKNANCPPDGILAYNYTSGEHIARVSYGQPIVARGCDSSLTLANFMRAMLYSSVATLALGMNVLRAETSENFSEVVGHGGFFKTPEIAQKIMSSALKTPVSVYENAGEGGAFGMAVLALYARFYAKKLCLAEFVQNIFKEEKKTCVSASPVENEDFEIFLRKFEKNLKVFYN